MPDLPSLPAAFTARLVGVTFTPLYPQHVGRLEALAARAYLHNQALGPIPAVLVREPENPHDPNSVRVDVLDGPLGHLARHLAARLAPRLDRGEHWRAEVREVLTNPARPNLPGVSVRVERVRDT